MAKPANITELRDQLLDAFDELKRDPRQYNKVKELSNTAGKILGTLKVQLEYSFIKGEEPDISFMGKTSGKPLKPGAKLLNV